MHKRQLTCYSLLLVLWVVSPSALQEAAVGAPPAERNPQSDAKRKGGIATLYALDPLAHTFCFADGQYGMVFSNREVYNRASDIDFNSYEAGRFSIGVEGGQVGAIIDLGSAADLQKKYGYSETVGNGQGFASIHRKDGKILIRKDDKDTPFQPIKEADELFREGKTNANAAVKLGHIYLLRLTGHNAKAFERVVKLLVLSYKEGESVTIRWEVLE